ncbi:MAG: CobW family GTP-binding protein [Pseudomonadota bacterium]
MNIDAELVSTVETDVIGLANGCVCCNLRGDLMDAVLAVLERPERPQCVLLEASGVADPMAIAATFNDPDLSHLIRLDSITCVVDAEQVFASPELESLKLWQIAAADLLILNKIDLVTADHRARVRAWLDSRFHRYRLIEASRCDVPLALVLSAGRFDALRFGGEGEGALPRACAGPDCPDHGAHRHRDFSVWSYETDRPLDQEALRQAAGRLPTSIYRCKGVLRTEAAPDRRTILQVVGKRVELRDGGRWDEGMIASRIVAIGAADADDRDALDALFTACRA